MLPISLRVGAKNRKGRRELKRGGGGEGTSLRSSYLIHALTYAEVSVCKRGKKERKEGRKERQRNVKGNLEGKRWRDICRYDLLKQLQNL